MLIQSTFGLAVQDMGMDSSVLIGASIFAVLFIISFGWVTKGPGQNHYGRYQQRNTSNIKDA